MHPFPPAAIFGALFGSTMVKSLKALLLFASAALLAATVWANTTLFIEVSWNYNNPSGPDPAPIQEGSIVQIIGWNSSVPPSPENASNGGMTQYGTHPSDDPNEDPVPVLLPNTVEDSWQILGTTHVQQMSGNYYSVSIAIEIPSNVDKIFVRVFDVTDFPAAPEVVDGYWGISSATNVSDTIGTGYTWFDNVAVTNHAYFEVIPEPATVALIGSGLLAIAFRRKRKIISDVSDRSSHDEGGLS